MILVYFSYWDIIYERVFGKLCILKEINFNSDVLKLKHVEDHVLTNQITLIYNYIFTFIETSKMSQR